MAMASSQEIKDISSHKKSTESDSLLKHPPRQIPEGSTPVQRTVPTDQNDVYPNKGKKRLALVFNQEKFYLPGTKTRVGTEFDKKSLQSCFEKYKFDIEPLKDDMKVDEITNKLKEVAARDHSKTDCIAVAVLTHGNGRGELAAYNGWYTRKELIEAFNNCTYLTGKPKLFFIQACRGGTTSPARIQADSSESNIYSFPEEADVLVFYSTFEGRKAFRDPLSGTWFIQDLCSELMKNGEKDDLLTMLTRVNFSVATRETDGKKQMPVIQSTLTRKYYLSNKLNLNETDFGVSNLSDQLKLTETDFDISSILDETLDLLKQLDAET